MTHQTVNNISGWPQDVERQILSAKMDVATIRRHQQRVLESLSRTEKRTFPILDTCRIDNGGILRLPPRAPRTEGHARSVAGDCGIVALIPAAGASSRYLTPLVPLMDGARLRSVDACRKAVEHLNAVGIKDSPLPRSVKSLMSALSEGSMDLSPQIFDDVIREIDAPKALYPAVLDGDTFLRIKRLEHSAIGGFLGEIYISPPGRIEDFTKETATVTSEIPATFIEQDLSLATLRFEADGRIALDAHGQVSPVPAGHGALLQLFPKVSQMHPGARAVFIRNIDNISGDAADVVDVTRNFMECFTVSVTILDQLRAAVRQCDMEMVLEHCQSWLTFWGVSAKDDESALDLLLEKFFRTPPCRDFTRLTQILGRPLVLMGQVPNTAKDVGGTCVFTRLDSRVVKLCLEVPHASDADRQAFLENPAKATHFNPVFVLSEIPDATAMATWNDHPFWLIARKSWQGRDVFYQESILYEMLGCSAYANVLYVEVPRCVFNPHKSLQDAGQKRLKDWIKV